MFLFTKFLLFICIWWMIFFISLPIKISVPTKWDEGHATSAPKKTYIGVKVIVTTLLSFFVMFFLIMINFDLGVLFK